MEEIRRQIKESIAVKQSILDNEEIIKTIDKTAQICVNALKKGNKILFAGNGGSAADAQHLTAELVCRFGFDRPPLAAIALTTNTSVLTSVSNDYDFNIIFSRQIEAIGSNGDVLVVLSTSGSSPNIIEGISSAKQKGIFVIGLTGMPGGKMASMCDLIIKVPSSETPRIQECHILIGHIICNQIEMSIFKNEQK
ncbi:MAG TPA: D-sedoheptulose 7-phosphate isomerase [Bacteroidales bacterium]|nr:D-sedoheptulose 7-phosphate isomerase [Bacteroidales bacterium]HQG36338.1 D-sedoheptulose 7-phosphate isomerase [Bacteroidales bacterium]HQG52478.1 D-sedoheptulose 7-phosphate isomerase [Bacteroidales bacterium]HQJ20029.1 D-sedoheptulose 7-phosphate isomerase [Bacteroidales bacterium]